MAPKRLGPRRPGRQITGSGIWKTDYYYSRARFMFPMILLFIDALSNCITSIASGTPWTMEDLRVGAAETLVARNVLFVKNYVDGSALASHKEQYTSNQTP